MMPNRLKIVASLGCMLLLLLAVAMQAAHAGVDDSSHRLAKTQPVTRYVSASCDIPDSFALSATPFPTMPEISGRLPILPKTTYPATTHAVIEHGRSPPAGRA